MPTTLNPSSALQNSPPQQQLARAARSPQPSPLITKNGIVVDITLPDEPIRVSKMPYSSTNGLTVEDVADPLTQRNLAIMGGRAPEALHTATVLSAVQLDSKLRRVDDPLVVMCILDPLRRILASMTLRRLGFQVRATGCAREASLWVRQERDKIHLIITEQQLRNGSHGTDVLRQARIEVNNGCGTIPVVALLHLVRDSPRVISLGFDHFLVGPLSLHRKVLQKWLFPLFKLRWPTNFSTNHEKVMTILRQIAERDPTPSDGVLSPDGAPLSPRRLSHPLDSNTLPSPGLPEPMKKQETLKIKTVELGELEVYRPDGKDKEDAAIILSKKKIENLHNIVKEHRALTEEVMSKYNSNVQQVHELEKQVAQQKQLMFMKDERIALMKSRDAMKDTWVRKRNAALEDDAIQLRGDIAGLTMSLKFAEAEVVFLKKVARQDQFEVDAETTANNRFQLLRDEVDAQAKQYAALVQQVARQQNSRQSILRRVIGANNVCGRLETKLMRMEDHDGYDGDTIVNTNRRTAPTSRKKSEGTVSPQPSALSAEDQALLVEMEIARNEQLRLEMLRKVRKSISTQTTHSGDVVVYVDAAPTAAVSSTRSQPVFDFGDEPFGRSGGRTPRTPSGRRSSSPFENDVAVSSMSRRMTKLTPKELNPLSTFSPAEMSLKSPKEDSVASDFTGPKKQPRSPGPALTGFNTRSSMPHESIFTRRVQKDSPKESADGEQEQEQPPGLNKSVSIVQSDSSNDKNTSRENSVVRFVESGAEEAHAPAADNSITISNKKVAASRRSSRKQSVVSRSNKSRSRSSSMAVSRVAVRSTSHSSASASDADDGGRHIMSASSRDRPQQPQHHRPEKMHFTQSLREERRGNSENAKQSILSPTSHLEPRTSLKGTSDDDAWDGTVRVASFHDMSNSEFASTMAMSPNNQAVRGQRRSVHLSSSPRTYPRGSIAKVQNLNINAPPLPQHQQPRRPPPPLQMSPGHRGPTYVDHAGQHVNKHDIAQHRPNEPINAPSRTQQLSYDQPAHVVPNESTPMVSPKYKIVQPHSDTAPVLTHSTSMCSTNSNQRSANPRGEQKSAPSDNSMYSNQRSANPRGEQKSAPSDNSMYSNQRSANPRGEPKSAPSDNSMYSNQRSANPRGEQKSAPSDNSMYSNQRSANPRGEQKSAPADNTNTAEVSHKDNAKPQYDTTRVDVQQHHDADDTESTTQRVDHFNAPLSPEMQSHMVRRPGPILDVLPPQPPGTAAASARARPSGVGTHPPGRHAASKAPPSSQEKWKENFFPSTTGNSVTPSPNQTIATPPTHLRIVMPQQHAKSSSLDPDADSGVSNNNDQLVAIDMDGPFSVSGDGRRLLCRIDAIQGAPKSVDGSLPRLAVATSNLSTQQSSTRRQHQSRSSALELGESTALVPHSKDFRADYNWTRPPPQNSATECVAKFLSDLKKSYPGLSDDTVIKGIGASSKDPKDANNPKSNTGSSQSVATSGARYEAGRGRTTSPKHQTLYSAMMTLQRQLQSDHDAHEEQLSSLEVFWQGKMGDVERTLNAERRELESDLKGEIARLQEEVDSLRNHKLSQYEQSVLVTRQTTPAQKRYLRSVCVQTYVTGDSQQPTRTTLENALFPLLQNKGSNDPAPPLRRKPSVATTVDGVMPRSKVAEEERVAMQIALQHGVMATTAVVNQAKNLDVMSRMVRAASKPHGGTKPKHCVRGNKPSTVTLPPVSE